MNVDKLRALLLKNSTAGTYDNNANHEIIIALPALLDRLEKLEAVAEAARRAQEMYRTTTGFYAAYLDVELSKLEERV